MIYSLNHSNTSSNDSPGHSLD